MKPKPIAFLSYVRFDDKHDEGRITKFRERLSQEVRMQTGEEFAIFQDRNDIHWGQNWKERIEESLDGSTFLIPILMPSFFRSKYCREETERFLEREKRLNRNDLILPVYYVDCPLLNDEAKRATDKLAQILSSRQAINWRELRFKSNNSPKMRKSLEQLAIQIRDALERVMPAIESGQEAGATGSESKVSESSAVAETVVVAPKAEPRTRIVDAMHRGDHATISEAIKAVAPGERILVRSGLYREGIVLDKLLEIIGDGQLGDVVIEATGANVVLFKTTMGRVTNLTLRQIGGTGKWFGVNIAQGRLDLEKCDISSQSSACIAIHAGADPRVRENKIHDGKASGVFVYENGQGTLENNDIFGNALAGVEIKTGGNPTLRRNRICKNVYEAIWVYDKGGGTFEDNDLRDNQRGAWDIARGCKSKVKRIRNLE